MPESAAEPTQHAERVASFRTLPLSRAMMGALAAAGYDTPSPIQAALIPLALQGVDVIGQAKTGTGKTASFAIPLIEMLEARGKGPQAIVLAPTRELVQQIVGEFEKLSYGQDARVCGIYGGEPIQRQLRALERGVDLVIGTPGRVIDHIERRTLFLGDVFHVVLDEADRMLDIGFRPDIERILKRVPTPHQTLLLSATISTDIERLAQRYMFQPEVLNLSRDEPSVESIQQYYVTVDQDRKLELLVHLLGREQPRQCIIFTRTRKGADRLAEKLSRQVRGVATIHGDLPQTARNRVMQGFRDGTIPILVATDVVGRGIDVVGISHVVNFDIPDDPENYLHRIGRTGRMGKDGVSFTFVRPDEGGPLTSIELLINRPIDNLKVEGFDSSGHASAKPPAFRELWNSGGKQATRPT
jgi:ATP-dependent RNA helicase DeaD